MSPTELFLRGKGTLIVSAETGGGLFGRLIYLFFFLYHYLTPGCDSLQSPSTARPRFLDTLAHLVARALWYRINKTGNELFQLRLQGKCWNML